MNKFTEGTMEFEDNIIDYIKYLLQELQDDPREIFPKWQYQQSLLSIIGWIYDNAHYRGRE
jgi:hypothetical protein